MPVYKRIVREGITSETEYLLAASHSPEEMREDQKRLLALAQENIQINTFDGRVAKVEEFCRRHHLSDTRSVIVNGVECPLPIAPQIGSKAWYADAILRVIASVRDALARGDVQLAVSEAVEVGVLISEAQAKFSNWPNLLLQDARTRKNRALSRRSAAARRADAMRRDDEDILPLADVYRAKHPEVTRDHSTRNMARTIARDLDMKEGTVRDRLSKRGRR
jgi:hypothetical protein